MNRKQLRVKIHVAFIMSKINGGKTHVALIMSKINGGMPHI